MVRIILCTYTDGFHRLSVTSVNSYIADTVLVHVDVDVDVCINIYIYIYIYIYATQYIEF